MIIVEEKIDGANLGISLTDACQNWWSWGWTLFYGDISSTFIVHVIWWRHFEKPETYWSFCKEQLLRVFWVASTSNHIALRRGNCMLPARLRTSFFQTGIIPHPFHGTFVIFLRSIGPKKEIKNTRKHAKEKTNQYSIITSGVTFNSTKTPSCGQANYEPLYQNRSHYVSSGYATQWKALDSWWEEHGWAVCQLLEPEEAQHE